MKAFGLVSFDVAASVIDVPEPLAGPGEALVRVRASSVNNFDVGVASGAMKQGGVPAVEGTFGRYVGEIDCATTAASAPTP